MYKRQTLTTPAIILKGNQLSINARIRVGASLRVAVMDAEGNPIPGFEEQNCLNVTGDNLTHTMRWKNHDSLQTLANQPVKLRISFNNGELYSFRVD